MATDFHAGDMNRHTKVLCHERVQGLPVELWKCQYENDQVKYIVQAMIERHEEDGIQYGDMTCLF